MPKLTGIVVSKINGRGLPFVAVYLDGFATATDNQGRFSIDAPIGTYTLKVRTRGYRPYTLTGFTLDTDKQVRVELEYAEI